MLCYTTWTSSPSNYYLNKDVSVLLDNFTPDSLWELIFFSPTVVQHNSQQRWQQQYLPCNSLKSPFVPARPMQAMWQYGNSIGCHGNKYRRLLLHFPRVVDNNPKQTDCVRAKPEGVNKLVEPEVLDIGGLDWKQTIADVLRVFEFKNSSWSWKSCAITLLV